MTTKKISQWLEELYEFDPSLKEHETALRQLIPQMIAAKPESGFSPELAQQIKTRLERDLKKLNYKSMPEKRLPIWRPILVWSTGVMAMLFLAITIYQIVPSDNIQRAQKSPENGIKKVAAAAFGPLNSQGVGVNESRTAAGLGGGANNVNQSVTMTKELSITASDSSVSTTVSVDTLEADTLAPVNAVGMGGDGTEFVQEKMVIMPITNYRFSYQGEPLDLSNISNTVYKRLKSQNGFAVASLLSGLAIDAVNLSSFSNLKATYVSLAEDKPFGLTASFDFNEDSVSLYSNWEKWQNPERENCQDQACWDRFRVRYEDIPEDSVAIAATNEFLSNLGIDLNRYGQPSVNNYWRQWYDQAEDKANYYFSETVSVTYPLLIEGQEVSGSSGEPDGLWVSYNILEKRVSDAGAFTPYNYEASEYTTETSTDRLIGLAEAGGWNQYGYYFNEGMEGVEVVNKELGLGTPRQGLIRFWSYQNNVSQELFAPALIFPVLDAPADYYGSKNIIVPLTQDLINELEQRNNQNNVGIMSTSVSAFAR
ncbi:MAG: hypothetical protein JST_000676 [Candidatus Parcubacteria bacterium]|nr:MAG: hypothetical protein JST_6260 [Candidatus Parcubacteria bacterium]